MRYLSNIAILILISCQVMAQNLVPNCSFERRQPCDFYNPSNHSSFAPMQCTADWESDSYGESSHIWFGWPNAKTGDNYASVLIYHPEAPNNRGYLQAQLCQPLQAGKEYLFEMYVKLETFCQYSSSNIGVHFPDERIRLDDYSLIQFPPHIENDPKNVIDNSDNWHLIKGTYTAKGTEKYILIGNFYNDEKTVTKKLTKAMNKPYISFYIDDVVLYSEGDSVDCCKPPVVAEEPIDTVQDTIPEEPKPQKMFTLENVYFEIDKAELLPESFEELNEILDVLNEMDYERIEVKGHTDNTGTEERNAELSLERAKAVADYFISNGIDASVITYEGFGSSKPIASNDTDEGRQKNRRVEVLIH